MNGRPLEEMIVVAAPFFPSVLVLPIKEICIGSCMPFSLQGSVLESFDALA
jgi:hypothetical protein